LNLEKTNLLIKWEPKKTFIQLRIIFPSLSIDHVMSIRQEDLMIAGGVWRMLPSWLTRKFTSKRASNVSSALESFE
jgi:hypothetical protein